MNILITHRNNAITPYNPRVKQKNINRINTDIYRETISFTADAASLKTFSPSAKDILTKIKDAFISIRQVFFPRQDSEKKQVAK